MIISLALAIAIYALLVAVFYYKIRRKYPEKVSACSDCSMYSIRNKKCTFFAPEIRIRFKLLHFLRTVNILPMYDFMHKMIHLGARFCYVRVPLSIPYDKKKQRHEINNKWLVFVFIALIVETVTILISIFGGKL
ncbi:MAG: hypothetical protein HQ556_03245 [Candidatus Marinimicrobia bacterium]|nr:hypothetical protein [Candidatus Neomarinimicrobiota bacterium]